MTEFEPVIFRNIEFYNDNSEKYDDDLIEILQRKPLWELRCIINKNSKKNHFLNVSKEQLIKIIIEEGLM